MKMASETTPLTSGEESRTYLFLSQRHRNRRNRVRQFQCCVCAAMLGIFVTAMVITVSYSMNHDPDDDQASNETNTQVLLPVPANTAALKTLLSLKWPRPDIAPPDWPAPMPTDAQISKAIEAGELSLQKKDEIEARAAMKKGDPSSPSILQLGTPFYMHQEAIKTTANAIKAARVGYVMGKATEELTKGKSKKHSVGKGPQVNPYYIPTGLECKAKSLSAGMNSSSSACPPSRYRTMDGTCNNLVHPDWGIAMRPLRRVIPPDYSDGVSNPRAAKDGSSLPSARDVSLTVHRPIYRNDPNFTVMLAVWGQFFDHDITATALSKSSDGTPISCCTEDGKVATENVNPECYPVKLSVEDPYYADYGMSCMNFVRSAPAPTCNLGPREQLNQITSFIDGSVVYGSSDEQAKHLRSTSKKGELQMTVTPDGRELLPVSTDPKDGCNKPEMNADGKYCFKSGDTRANENLHLTTMHLLLAREHNRIVRELAQMNPTWSDEKLYQEGRHIIAAQMQHITYNEFLPIVLGPSMMNRLQLAPQKKGFANSYDPEVNPAVANNFATAAFRFAHTLLPTLMKILGNDTSSEEYVELHKILFNPYILYSPGQMDSALKGALNTDVQRVDTYITPEVTQHLFQQKWSEDYDKAMEKSGAKLQRKKKGYGLDLASLNVQRGRDHGLPSYPEWREYCGLSRPTSFADLKGEMDEAALERLASLYNSVDDVDMYSGSLSEIPIGEGLLGPTFSCLMADQFLRLKNGDRYWYETPELPQAFDPYQLDEIRRSSLAAIICENSGVDRVQQWVMQAVDDDNPRMMCEFIPRLRLAAWKDKSMVGHVKLSPLSMNVRTMPKKSEDLTAPAGAFGSSFIKGTVMSASISAMGSDGSSITALKPSATFPVTIPSHLFDQKIPVAAGVAPGLPDGIIPPFYHGGGGVTWTGSLTSSDPTKAHLTGSFSVPVFKHGATAFDFSMTTYTGSFNINLNLAPTATPLVVPTLQGTYNSGIFFKTEPPTFANSPLSVEEVENLMAEAGKAGPKLPMAPILLYGAFSLDLTEFYWDGNVSVVIPPPAMPVLAASSGEMIKPKAASTLVDVTAVWGLVKAKVGPPTDPGADNSKVVVTTWWDGKLPIAIPQPAFDRTVMAPSYAAASGKSGPGNGVTWSGSLMPIDGSNDVELNGTYSFPVFLHGSSPSGFTLQIWRGDFSIKLHSSPAPGTVPLATSLRMLGSGVKYKSPIIFKSAPQVMAPPESSDDEVSNITIPVILHGFTSIDKSIFYWNGSASIIVPQMGPNTLMAHGKGGRGRNGGRGGGHSSGGQDGGFGGGGFGGGGFGGGGGMFDGGYGGRFSGGNSMIDRYGFEQSKLQAAGAGAVGPVILKISSASVTMSSTLSSNAPGKNLTWNGEFPLTLPQSPFYRKDPILVTGSDIDVDYPYSPLAAPASSEKVSYKSELTWSNLSVKINDSSPNDMQINGTLSFPVFYFPQTFTGPWPGATIETWNGNFSVVVNANSTTGSPTSVDNVLTLLKMGNFTSTVTYVEEKEAEETGKLAAAGVGAASSDAASPLKVTMLLHGIKSLDKMEFYWTGVITLIISGMPTDTTELNSLKAVLSRNHLKAAGGGVTSPLELQLTSGSISMASVLSTNGIGKNFTWDGVFPVTFPQSPFYRKTLLSSSAGQLTAPASSAKKTYKSELTWSNLSVKIIDTATNDLQINGSLSYPVYYFPGKVLGPWPGPTIENWSGNFSVIVNANSTTGTPPPISDLMTLISMGNFTSVVYFTETKKSTQSGKLSAAMGSSDPDATTPLKVIMLLHGTKSMDLTQFFWSGAATVIIRGLPTAPPVATEFSEYASASPAAAGGVAAPLNLQITSGSVSMASVLNTNGTGKNYTWDGVFPVTLPQSPFYRKTLLTSPYLSAGLLTAPASSAKKTYKSELTWSNLSVKIIDTATNDLQINGSLSYPVYYFPGKVLGPWPGPTIENWSGNFSVIVNANSTTGTPPPISDLMTLISMGNFTSVVYFTETKKSTQSGKLSAAMGSSDPDATTPLKVIMLLHGTKSMDLTQFFWSGAATVIIRGLPTAPPVATEFSEYASASPAAAGGVAAPLNLQITSGSVSMASVLNTNGTGKNYTWDGVFPVTLPQSPFYRKTLLTSPYLSAGLLTAPASSAKKTYKSELTWSNLSVKMINTATNDLQINGSLSYPVYYFPGKVLGPWPGPTIENWSGNFSVTVNANSTTGTPVPLTSLMALINMGNFTSTVYFTETKKAMQSGKLAAAMGTSDPDVTTPMKVIMLLQGTKSVDLTEFYWNGAATVIISGLPTPPPVATKFSTYLSASPASTVGVTPPMDLQISSGTVSMASVLNTNGTEKNYTWDVVFPVTLPQSPFYRKTSLTSSAGRLAAPASPAKATYKSELTWSNLSVTMINTATNDLQINGSLSYPVYYFPASVIGPWAGPTIENWSGNFSVIVNANSTTGTPAPLSDLMILFNMGNFTSSVYFTEEIKSTNSRKLAAAMAASDPDMTTPLEVIMLLRGTKSLDLTEFYWSGAVTVIIKGLPMVAPSMVEESTFTGVAPNTAPMVGSYISGRVTSGNLLGSSTSGGSYWWSGSYPVPIGIPAFDTVSPNAGIFTWPFSPTFYNGTGGVTWKGSLSRVTSGKNGLSVTGSFTVPVFTHGNPSAYSVDEWSGSFEIEIDLYVDSPLIDSFPGGVHNSPLIFREHKPSASGDMSGSISNAVNEVQNMMMMSRTLTSSSSVRASQPRTPIILWGHYSVDKSIFFWEGNATIIFEASPSPLMASMNKVSADIDSEVTPPSQNLKLPFKILTGSMTVSSPVFGKKVLWDGKIPFTTLTSYFNGPNPNTSYIGGSMKWTGHITRSTDVLNGATFEGSYILPIFVHSNGGVMAETMTGDFSMSVSFTGTQNIVDWVPNAGTYSSIITIAPGKPSVQLSLESSSNPFINLAVSKLTKMMDEDIMKEDPNLVMVLPACFFGDYDATHFTFSGDGITIVPTNVSALVQPKRQSPKVSLSRRPVSFPARSSSMMLADAESDVMPPSQNLKLPFKILTGSMTVSSPIFGKKLLWDGKIPFTTLTSYFNGPNPTTSYIGGSMKWTGHITRSTDVLNGATFEGSYMLPIFVHSNGGVMAETMTGDFSMSVSFTGTQNIVDWVPNAGTYSSIITIAPGKPSVQLSLESTNNPFINLGVNKLMKLMEDDVMNEDPNVVMVLPACFFGDYDDTHFTFSGDGITIIPTNVSALVRPKRKTEVWENPLTERHRTHLGHSHGKVIEPSNSRSRSLRLKGEYTSQSKNIKLNFKIESGSLTVKSSGVGEMVLWDGKIPFTTLQSYFNGYSENTSFIGGPMKWTGHISRAAAEGNGAQIEGSFSVPVFVHSNDSEALEYMTGDLSMHISFIGTENIADYVPTEGKFSSILTIAPAHPNVELSMKQSQIETKNNVLLDMALNDLMNSIESENADLDTGDFIPMPICFFGYYDAEKYTFNGDAIVIIPANLTNPASLEYESIVEDMEPSTKLQIGAASPYISGTVTSGNVMGLSKAGNTYWWSGTLPLPISMPPFDSISPNAAVFNWPYNPTFYNGTGGVTWSGNMALTSSVKNGLSIEGSFSVPVFNHGNPSAFSVDEWNGDFQLEMSVIYNNTELGSSFPKGTFNSPLIFREYKTVGLTDPSGYDLEAIKEVENMMILTGNLGVSGGIHSAVPRVPVILWGNYSADKTAFFWGGNITAIFPPMPTNLFTALDQQASEKVAEDTSAASKVRLPMNILAGKITSTSPVFGEKTLWDGSVPFTALPSYFNKYSTNSSYIGGPVQWAGQISRNTAIGNGAQIKGSFVVPIIVPSNGTESFEYLSGEFSFVVSFNGTQNLADLVPNSGKYTSYVILGVSHDEYDSYMADYTDEEPETPTDKNTHLALKMKQLRAIPDSSAVTPPTVMSIIFLGNYGLKGFTFTGEAIALLPETLPTPAAPKLLQSSSKRNSPAGQYHDMPYPSSNFPYGQMNDFPYHPAPFPSNAPPKPKPMRKIKLFGIVKSGQIYGNNLGHRAKPMWTGSFPAIIPMPAFDRRSHHNETHPGHPHHPHRMDGGITWQATEMEMGRDAGYIEGNFFFPIYKHGKFHTYTIKMMAGHFSFTFTLPGDQSIQRMVKYWKKYTSKMYFHHFHSDWDLFNPGIQGDQVRDKANKADGKVNKRDNNNGPIIILKGKRNNKAFEWSGKFILVFYV